MDKRKLVVNLLSFLFFTFIAFTNVYDGDGNRVRKIVGTTTNLYLVDDKSPSGFAQVVEEKVLGSTTNIYCYGLDLVSQSTVNSQSSTKFYGYDGNGNTRFLTGTNAAVTDTYTYDAFGILLTNTGTTVNFYRYSGEQFDPNLGFVYLRARYLNPNSGRFLSRDSLAGKTFDPPSLHRYTYVANNPVNRIDPSGLEFTFSGLLTAIAINATISAIITFPIDYAFHRSVSHALKSAGFSAIIGGALGAFFYAGGAVLAASDVAVIDASVATGSVEVTEGGLIIGIIKNGQVVSYSLPNTSHAFLASQAGVLTSDGSLIAGAEVFSISKEGGKLLITGSFNFNRFVSATGDATLKAFFK